jgi:hypothetical protein
MEPWVAGPPRRYRAPSTTLWWRAPSCRIAERVRWRRGRPLRGRTSPTRITKPSCGALHHSVLPITQTAPTPSERAASGVWTTRFVPPAPPARSALGCGSSAVVSRATSCEVAVVALIPHPLLPPVSRQEKGSLRRAGWERRKKRHRSVARGARWECCVLPFSCRNTGGRRGWGMRATTATSQDVARDTTAEEPHPRPLGPVRAEPAARTASFTHRLRRVPKV